MCGDIEEEDRIETALYERFVGDARGLVARAARAGTAPDAMTAYLDGLFAKTLSACVHDGEHADAADRYRVMAMQAVVFARLAGFLAGHVARAEDPMRKAIEALIHGYGEAETAEPDHGHAHDHDHDHHHGHGHHHH